MTERILAVVHHLPVGFGEVSVVEGAGGVGRPGHLAEDRDDMEQGHVSDGSGGGAGTVCIDDA